jgi:hypothetical protein
VTARVRENSVSNIFAPFYVRMSVRCISKSINLSNEMRLHTVYLLLQTSLHVSGSDAAHHQEHIQLHSQQLVLVVVSELLPPTIVVGYPTTIVGGSS